MTMDKLREAQASIDHQVDVETARGISRGVPVYQALSEAVEKVRKAKESGNNNRPIQEGARL